MSSLSFLTGFGASVSLIVAIGAQNAFVIRQSLRCQHLLLTALLCAGIDALLILLGVLGFGTVVGQFPLFIAAVSYFAALFLMMYGLASLRSAFKAKSWIGSTASETALSAKKTILSLLAFSLLNPHVYLDTVILLGSIAAQQPADQKICFAAGAVSASFAWFFAITYGAHLLAPLFQRQAAWKVLDSLSGFTMLGIAWILIQDLVASKIATLLQFK